MKKAISRRNFLKRTSAGIVGVSLTPFLSGSAVASTEKTELADPNIYNPFFRPDVISDRWYGSGQVNLTDLSMKDADDIEYGNHFYPDYADVDGNGDSSSLSARLSDAQLVRDRISGEIAYLPGDWNRLQTPQEKINWIDLMALIDQTNKIIPHTGWDCTQFSNQFDLNFRNFKKTDPREADIPNIYDKTHLGRFNLPVYILGINYSNPEITDHAANAILVGNNPLNLDEWYLIEPQTDKRIDPHKLCEINNSEATFSIEYIGKFFSDGSAGYNFLLKFHVTPNSSECIDHHDKLILQKPIVAVKEEVPVNFSLEPNRPNPFNSGTTITYILEEPSEVVLDILSANGQHLDTLVDGYQEAGRHNLQWNARNQASGTYFYRIKTPKGKETKKMMLVK